jgi:hypothetical protein
MSFKQDNNKTAGAVVILTHMHVYFASLLILFSVSTQADILESGYRADFNLYASGFLIASTTRHLIKVQDGMEYQTFTQPEGIAKWYTSDILHELSRFKFNNKNHVSAQSYRYHLTGDDEEKIVNIKFDHNQQKVRLSTETEVHPLHAESYDSLSFQIALMQKLTQGETTMVVDIADQDGLYTYDAQVEEMELIQTEIGAINTLKVHMKNKSNGNLFTFWCAAEFNYLPVRIQLERQDSGIDSVLEITAFHEPLKLP